MPLDLDQIRASVRQAVSRQTLEAKNGFERTFGSRGFQIQFSISIIDIQATTGGVASYPILIPSPGTGVKQYHDDTILLGVYMSGAFITTAGNETACVATGLASNSNQRFLGDYKFFLNLTVPSFAGIGPVYIQRNIGISFTAPFYNIVQQKTGLQLFGSEQAAMDYYVTAELLTCRSQDYEKYMRA